MWWGYAHETEADCDAGEGDVTSPQDTINATTRVAVYDIGVVAVRRAGWLAGRRRRGVSTGAGARLHRVVTFVADPRPRLALGHGGVDRGGS